MRKRWQTLRRTRPEAVRGAAMLAAILAAVSFVAMVWWVVSLRNGLPDEAALGRIGDMDQATAVYDDHDRLAFTIFKEQRIERPLSEISPNLRAAIVAIEDQRFYEHRGFDAVRIVAAALANLRHGRAVEGGSTITQQLARQSFLSPEKTIRRKLQELILASRIERRYSKPQILELYLNKVYFGDGLYGAGAAARGYFGKEASDLTVAQAALIAGLVKSPSTYAPTVNMTRAIARRNVVLQAMLDTGAIDRATWEAARHEKVVLRDDLRVDGPHGQYFLEQVRRELVDRFGWQRVYQGGLRVYSTIDMPMQIAAEAAVARSLKTLDAQRARVYRRAGRRGASDSKGASPSDDLLQAALLALDPATGHVTAMVGGRDFAASSFNRAVQARRQPGSAFKPFVYAAALESGFTPATVVDHLNDPIPTVQGDWTPEDEHLDTDAMTLRTGLRTSSNRAAVRLLQEVGIPRAVLYAKALGVGDVPSVPSLALGSGDVTLESMTAAYAAFDNHGLVPKPLLIRRVEDRDGHVLFKASDEARPAISDTTAFLMANMMADVINAGTAAGARQLGFTLPAAGKTGTTNNFRDAWFIGFTPKVVAGVWVGFDQPRTILPNGFASEVAVPLWTAFMKTATRGDQPAWLTPPPDVTTATVCRISGKLATDGCEHVDVVDKDGTIENRSMVYTEYFARGTEPTTYCDLHPSHGIFGRLASIFSGSGSQKPLPPHLDDVGLPPPVEVVRPAAPLARPAPPAQQQARPPQEPKRKRGFWARLLGLDGSDRTDETSTPQK